MGSTIDHDGNPSRTPRLTHGVVEHQSGDERSQHEQNGPSFSVHKQPLRNEREWSMALGEVTGDDVDDAFANITSDIKRPDTMPDGELVDVAIQSTRDEREHTAGDRTQQVFEGDIQEVLNIDEEREPPASVSETPRSSFVNPPPPPPASGVSLGMLLAVVVISSTLSVGLGCALTLLALSSSSVQHQLFGRSLDDGGPEPASAGFTSQVASREGSHDGGASPTPAASETVDASSAQAEEQGQDADAPSTVPSDGAPIAFTGDGASTVDRSGEQSDLAAAEAESPRSGVPDQMVLPISFVRGRPRIVEADRTALRSLARSIVSESRSRYELIGYAADDEESDPDRLRHLKARRAVKARDLIRSFGPSSQRFRSRAAESDEPQPALEDREGQHGAVLLRRIVD